MHVNASLKKLKTRVLFTFLLIVLCGNFTFGQAESILDKLYDEKSISFPVWVEMQSPPDVASWEWKPAKERLQELSAELLQLSIYGWEISYTPYDKRRNVKEYFSYKPLGKIAKDDSKIVFQDLREDFDKLSARLVYKMSTVQLRSFSIFEYVKLKSGFSRGRSPIATEQDGMLKAIQNSVLESVRAYARTIEKNKPREIIAHVRMVDAPILSTLSGDYIADLRVRLEIKEIKPYIVF